uniref:FG-GAP repeat protein n=1 Tax=Solibacter usitatus (strain Ellin6076) TaxID=234267 RepID=Q026Z2_SOLUE
MLQLERHRGALRSPGPAVWRTAAHRNNGDGTFTDASAESGVTASKGSYMMIAVATDFDNDGWPDLYVACDSMWSFMFHDNRNGHIRGNRPHQSGIVSTISGRKIALYFTGRQHAGENLADFMKQRAPDLSASIGCAMGCRETRRNYRREWRSCLPTAWRMEGDSLWK